MLVERAVDEALLAVVVAGPDRRDDRERVVARRAGEVRGAVEEARAEAAVLGGAVRGVAEADAAAVDVELAHEGAPTELVHEGRFARERQAEEADDPVFRRDELEEDLSPGVGHVLRVLHFEGGVVEGRAADLSRADLDESLTAPRDLVLGDLAEVGALVADHDVVARDVADHAGDPAVARHAG